MTENERIQNAIDTADALWKFGFFKTLENNGIIPDNDEQAEALWAIGQIKKAEFLQNILDDSTIGRIKRASAIEQGRGYEYNLPDEATCEAALAVLQDPIIKQACADYGYIMKSEGLL